MKQKKHPLLKIACPEIFKELHPTKNAHINIEALTCGSRYIMHWICKLGHEWKTTVINRALKQHGCSQCSSHKRKRARIPGEKQITTLSSRRIVAGIMSAIDIGDQTEIYLMEILLAHGGVNVERIGQTNSNADLIITHISDGCRFYLQVKTLSLNKKRINQHSVAMTRQKYADNMLIAMVDKTRKYFALDFFGNLKEKTCRYFNFTTLCSNWCIMYDNETEFAHDVIAKSRESQIWKSDTNLLTINYQKEQQMRQRFMIAAIANGLEFQNNITNGNSVDGFVNRVPVQLKFSSSVASKNIYLVHSSKAAWISGQSCRIPYDKTDTFEVLIVELGIKSGESAFAGQFCIVPKYVLVDRRIVSGTEQGSMGLSISRPSPHATREHWSLPFWNNWDCFKH